MPEHEIDNAKTYSTGELAAECGVSVRTIQYYDEKGLLPPSALTEGGRRVYTGADAAKLRRILFLKSIGLRLSAIKDLLASEVSTQVMLDVLREQDRRLAAEVEDRQSARAAIARMLEELEGTGELPAATKPGMEAVMKKEKWYRSELAPLYWRMLGVGIVLGIAEWGTLIYAIVTGNWWPFAIAMAVVVAACIPLVRSYRKRTAYLCAHCGEVFVPGLREWFFAGHTPSTRKVTCARCGEKDWCAEVSRERLAAS